MAKVIFEFDDMADERVSVTVTCEPEMPETKERLTNAQKIALQTIAIVEKIFEEKTLRRCQIDTISKTAGGFDCKA